MQHDDIWTVVIAIENGKKAQASGNVIKSRMSAHSGADKSGLIRHAFAVWNSRLAVEHVQAKLWKALISQSKERLGCCKIAGSDNSRIGRKGGEDIFQLFDAHHSHKLRIALRKPRPV